MPPRAGTSSDQVYEQQNDEQLDDLHGKIRALRGVTTDIYSDAERQNTQLDDTSNSFSAFGTSFARTTSNQARTFANSSGLKQHRVTLYTVAIIVGLWLLWKVGASQWGRAQSEAPTGL